MRFHIVMDRHTGRVVKAEQVADDLSLADAIADCDECRAHSAVPHKPAAFVSSQELDAAVTQALQSSPRWRRRQRGAR
jgi:hypothetical protein